MSTRFSIAAVLGVSAACAPAPPPGSIQPDASLASDAAPSPDATTHDDAGLFADAESTIADAGANDSGALPGPVRRERSLVWTDPRILDDPSIISFARAVSALAGDPHGGVFFDRLLRRFSTTAHSERAGPALLADELAQTLGADPATWDMSRLPFRVTGVHNRIDLSANGHCGELRVSAASTHPVLQPLHFIFLFRMLPPAADCRDLALRFARLSELDDAAFLAAVRTLIDEHVRTDRVIIAESLEFMVSPWEWRQWTKSQAGDLDNPPLFQTVDSERLNRAGAERDEFLRWVEANAETITNRRQAIPDRFRPPSARVIAGIERPPLSLVGLDPTIAARFPEVRQNLEIVGCPVCHTADADFVQTTLDRRFSPFYDKELDARAAALDAWVLGTPPNPPFGPLQPNPVLPP